MRGMSISNHLPCFRRRSLRLSLPAILLLLAVVAVRHPAEAREPLPPISEEWLTVAERTDFRATSSYDETLALLHRLAGEMPGKLRIESFGTSGEGRDMPLAILSAAGAFTPEAARDAAASERSPIAMIQSGIHAGEIDGKDATLMLLRDMALGRRPLPEATVLWIPIYNVDGHERVSPYNRPNQNGPVEGMGFRTNAAGLDLNRDHLKLASPEARALIGLFDRWRPDVHVDNHVTDGVDHDWVLTWSWAEAPQVAAPVGEWLDRRLPRVLAATEAAGHRVGPYVDLVARNDPGQGFSSRVVEPRYATGYYPLRNRPSILVENHSYKPYRNRVLANRDFLAALLAELDRSGDELIAAVRAADETTVALGRPDAEPSPLVLAWVPDPEPSRIRFPVYAWEVVESPALGVPTVVYERGEVDEIEVDWHHRSVPGLRVERPRGYLVLPGWPQIEARVEGHGLRYRRLERPAKLSVETIRISEPQLADSSYQGLARVEGEVTRRSEELEVPAGTLWIPADQPDFEVAAQLFEPEAPDSLFAWGLLSAALERKEYIGTARLDELAAEMLAASSEVAAEWEAALADEEIAADWRARWLWWYRRTPYWDDTVGRLPILRVAGEGLVAVTAALGDAAD